MKFILGFSSRVFESPSKNLEVLSKLPNKPKPNFKSTKINHLLPNNGKPGKVLSA
jgi:hypothetical protein